MNMEQTTPMINLPVVSIGSAITMSSREIADLCETRHNQAAETIARLMEAGVLRESRKTTRRVKPEGGGRPMEVYDLTKRDTLVVVSGYKDEVRARIIDRWLELEGQGAPAAIDVRNPNQLALIASQLIEVTQEQAKQIEAMQDTVQAHDRLCAADGSLCISDAAKNLGVRPKDLFDWLHTRSWIFRRSDGADWVAYAPRLSSGVMEHRVVTTTRPDGSEKVFTQARVTPKGLSALAKLITPTAKLIGGTAQ